MNLEPFLAVFGDLTIAETAAWIAAVVAIVVLYRKIKTYIIKQHDEEIARNQKMDEVIDQAKMYPTWRAQSLQVQKELTESIDGLRTAQTNLSDKLDYIEEQNRTRKRNELRERLLQAYRLYASPGRNPSLAWSEMEAEAFWESYKDYDDLGGNSHVHTVVRPAMRELEVVKMEDTERLAEIMKQRR